MPSKLSLSKVPGDTPAPNKHMAKAGKPVLFEMSFPPPSLTLKGAHVNWGERQRHTGELAKAEVEGLRRQASVSDIWTQRQKWISLCT